MEAPVSPPPAKRTRKFVCPRGKQSGGFAWLVVFEILYYVIVINHFLADTRNIRGSATMIRLRISLQIYIYKRERGPTHTPTHTFLFIYSSTWQGLEWRFPGIILPKHKHVLLISTSHNALICSLSVVSWGVY